MRRKNIGLVAAAVFVLSLPLASLAPAQQAQPEPVNPPQMGNPMGQNGQMGMMPQGGQMGMMPQGGQRRMMPQGGHMGMMPPGGQMRMMQQDGQMRMMQQGGQMGMMQQGGHMSGKGHHGMMQQGSHMGGKGHHGKMGHGANKGKKHKKMMAKHFVGRDKDYGPEDLRRIIDGRLAKNGFSRLKVGDVKDDGENNEKFALVEVVSANGEYLFRLRVNRRNARAMIID